MAITWTKLIPRWGGDTIEPPEAKKDTGYIAGDKPPAKWENWLRKGTYEALDETRTVVENIDSQLAQIEQDIQDVSTLANGKATTTTLSTTITTTWAGTTAPYTQAIAVTGIQAADNPIVDIDLSSVSVFADQQAIATDWAKVYRITTQSNQITVYTTDKSAVAIPIQLKVVR